MPPSPDHLSQTGQRVNGSRTAQQAQAEFAQIITDAAMRQLTPADFETPDPAGNARLLDALHQDAERQTGGGAAWGVLSVVAVLLIACACVVAVLLVRGWLRAGP